MKRLAFLAILLFATAAHAEAIPVEQYIGALERMHASLQADRIIDAKEQAAWLRGKNVGEFHVDESLLDAVSAATGADPALLMRIQLTLAELRSAEASPLAPDPKLLSEVASGQSVPELARAGEVPMPGTIETPLMERVAQTILEAFRWIGRKLKQFRNWLRDFFPRSRTERPEAMSGIDWLVIAVVILILIVIVVLAIKVMRRARGGERVVASTAPLHSSRDDDPLSRGATEWERYAAQLAAEGRFREAIRAWYHAVLVTCYATGALHFRKGRTNWEYIASLPASTTWRSELIRLTQRFEQEWYGADRSSEEAFEDCSEHARNVLAAVSSTERGAA